MSTISMAPVCTFKVVVIGTTNVGKSTMLFRLVNGGYNNTYTATIGVDFTTKSFTIDDQKVTLQLWDTAGQEKYRCLVFQYYKKVNAAIIVFDVTDRTTYKEVTYWIDTLNKFAPPDVIKILVGNKIDLTTARRVSVDEGNSLASSLGIKYFEISAKENIGITNIFELLAKNLMVASPIRKQSTMSEKSMSMSINKVSIIKPSKKGCC